MRGIPIIGNGIPLKNLEAITRRKGIESSGCLQEWDPPRNVPAIQTLGASHTLGHVLPGTRAPQPGGEVDWTGMRPARPQGRCPGVRYAAPLSACSSPVPIECSSLATSLTVVASESRTM